MEDKKFEPLKGKEKVVLIRYLPYGVFYVNDVKSAVQGLLKEIEEKCDEWYHIDYYQLPTWGEIKEELKNLIKKWFADVIEE